MSLTKTKKKLFPDPIPVPKDNPFIDYKYLGDDIDDLANQVMNRFDKYKRPRLIWDAMIYESVAFYAGYQNLYWNYSGAGALAVNMPESIGAVQAISNKIIGKCRTMINRLSSFDPTAQSLPASPSTSDIYAARACKKIVQSNHYSYGFKAIYQQFAEYVVVEGDGWLKTQYDSYGGRKTITYKVEPTFQEIEMEATQENEGLMQELGEWEEQPEKEIEENGGFDGKAETGDGGPEIMESENKDATGMEEEDKDGTENPDDAVAEGNENPTDEGQPEQAPKTRKFKIPVNHPVTGAPVMKQSLDEDGNPQIDKIDFDGCIRKDAIGPMNMFYNPVITQWKDAPDCIEVEYLSIDQVRAMYPGCTDLSEDDYENNNFNPWVQVFKTVIERNPYGVQWGIPVYEYHAKSSEDFPRGLRLIIVKNKVRDGGPEPTFNGEELPYDHSGFDPIPGAFRHMSLPMVLKNPQKIRNMLLSQYISNARLFENGRVLAQAGTKFSDKITNGNQVIYYGNCSNIPQFLNPSALSAAHEHLLDRIDNDFDTLSTINKTAEGNPPPSVTSAEMSEAVTENDYQGSQTVVDNFMLAISNSCNKELRLIKDQGPDEILVRFFGGPGGKNYVNKFKKAVLRNLPDVWITPGKSANQSRGQQRKDIELMLPIVTQQAGSGEQQKIIIDKAIDMMQMGDEEGLVGYILEQQNCILDKLAELDDSANIPDFTIKIMPWHDTKVWMDVITSKLLNEVEFNTLPEIVKKRLIDLYQQVIKVQTDKEQQAAAKMQGAPMPGGGPPKPGMPPPGGPPKPGMPTMGGPPQGAPMAPQGQPAPMMGRN